MKRPNTTTALLTVVAVLLALNLIATTSPAANNETATANGPPDPYIVELLVMYSNLHYRVWSDGRVDIMEAVGLCEFNVVTSYGPVEHPFPVVEAKFSEEHGNCATWCVVLLTYGDGRLDIVGSNVSGDRCTIAGIGTPSLCIGDVDRNGTVGIEDFLIVLAEWGCQ